MTARTNLVGASPGVRGAIHAASVPPLLDTLCEHAYAWAAAHVTFETAVDLSPVTRCADRLLRDRGIVTTAELRRDAARTELPDGCADLVIWAAPMPPTDGIETALAEAKRLCRPNGAVVCVLPAWAAERASATTDLREDASVELRPLIGAATGGNGNGAEADSHEAPAGYRIVVLRRCDAQAPPEPTLGEEPPATTIRDGERALRVELAARGVLEGVREDERAELLERVEIAEHDCSAQRERNGDLTRQLEEAELEKSTLRDQIKRAEAHAERLRTDLELHRQWLDGIQSSLSWRLTKPLRRGKGTLGR